jgi:hypothetical protein
MRTGEIQRIRNEFYDKIHDPNHPLTHIELLDKVSEHIKKLDKYIDGPVESDKLNKLEDIKKAQIKEYKNKQKELQQLIDKYSK